MAFQDRADAGRRLAERLLFLRDEGAVVLGLSRGGVPVAYEVARALDAPLDLIVVRKLGVPFQPELGMGAISEGGVRVINEEVLRAAGVTPAELDGVEERERTNLDGQAALLRAGRPPLPLDGRTAVVVDDGMATGSTARAACRSARARGAGRVVLAVPVASPESVTDLGREVEVVCLRTPRILWAVGQWYRDFSQTSDEEVVDLLARASRPAPSAAGPPVLRDPTVEIPTGFGAARDPATLVGDLAIPEDPGGLVIFAHGSGSSRHSPRNRFVAERLNRDRLATLLFDLLTPWEETDRRNVFDVELLGRRLLEVTAWAAAQPETAGLATGYFGASTGAAAALLAAAAMGDGVSAVVSRGGRPDLAGDSSLAQVAAPTLLIVGGEDREVLRLNRHAQSRLTCESRLTVVPGATHLFEEPGALAAVADLAGQWFCDHLPDRQSPAA